MPMQNKKYKMERVKTKLLFGILLTLTLTASGQQNDTIADGKELLEHIYKKYSQDWYKNITLKSEIFRYKDDSLVSSEVWFEAYSAPSQLHIRYKDFDTGRGWLIVNDTLYSFSHTKMVGSRPRLHELMILGFDAYVVSPEIVAEKIVRIGFDVSKIEATTKNGKKVIQVGNPDAQCFWVDIESFLFYGMRKVAEGSVKETFFDRYETIYGKPVATQIQYFQDGHLVLFEKYFDIRLPSSLPNEFFHPENFAETRW